MNRLSYDRIIQIGRQYLSFVCMKTVWQAVPYEYLWRLWHLKFFWLRLTFSLSLQHALPRTWVAICRRTRCPLPSGYPSKVLTTHCLHLDKLDRRDVTEAGRREWRNFCTHSCPRHCMVVVTFTRPTSTPGGFFPGERAPGLTELGSCFGHRAGLDILAEIKLCCSPSCSPNTILILILIYLLTVIGLTHGGSSTVHIYTHKQYIEQHIIHRTAIKNAYFSFVVR